MEIAHTAQVKFAHTYTVNRYIQFTTYNYKAHILKVHLASVVHTDKAIHKCLK